MVSLELLLLRLTLIVYFWSVDEWAVADRLRLVNGTELSLSLITYPFLSNSKPVLLLTWLDAILPYLIISKLDCFVLLPFVFILMSLTATFNPFYCYPEIWFTISLVSLEF